MTGKTFKLLVFDLAADLGHFRRPEYTATHATYPFITRTALREQQTVRLNHWNGEAWAGHPAPESVAPHTIVPLGKGYLGTQTSTSQLASGSISNLTTIYYWQDLFDEVTKAWSKACPFTTPTWAAPSP